MSIHKIGSDIIRPLGTKGRKPAERKADGDANGPAARTPRTDQVGFSPEALALAEQSLSVEDPLSPERLALIQSRVDSGFYDSAEVAEEVARRIFEAGDLEQLV